MGFWSDRADAISGAESVELYYQYLRTRSPSIRDTILLHNKDDVLQLSRLLKILEKLDLHKIMFYTGFIVCQDEKKVIIKKIQVQKDTILISGFHKNIPMEYRGYTTSHEAKFSKQNNDFILKIHFKTSRSFCYVNLDEFNIDYSDLEKYAGFHKGHLIIKDGIELQFGELNHLIQLILKGILKEL